MKLSQKIMELRKMNGLNFRSCESKMIATVLAKKLYEIKTKEYYNIEHRLERYKHDRGYTN